MFEVGQYIKFKMQDKLVIGEIMYITENSDTGNINFTVETDNDFIIAVDPKDIKKVIFSKNQYTLIKNKLKHINYYLYTSDEEKVFGVSIANDNYYIYNLASDRYWNHEVTEKVMNKKQYNNFKHNNNLYELSEIKDQSDIFDFL